MSIGDETTIEEIIRQHTGFVHAMALKYSPVPGLAQDVTQQVFLEFLKKRQQWDLSRDVKPLLAEMTRIVARRFWQESCRKMTLEMESLAEHVRQIAESTPIEPIMEEERAALRKCIEKLPERSRLLVRARYYVGANSVELANRLEMTPAAVRRALFRLRQKLRTCIRGQLRGHGFDHA